MREGVVWRISLYEYNTSCVVFSALYPVHLASMSTLSVFPASMQGSLLCHTASKYVSPYYAVVSLAAIVPVYVCTLTAQ